MLHRVKVAGNGFVIERKSGEEWKRTGWRWGKTGEAAAKAACFILTKNPKAQVKPPSRLAVALRNRITAECALILPAKVWLSPKKNGAREDGGWMWEFLDVDGAPLEPNVGSPHKPDLCLKAERLEHETDAFGSVHIYCWRSSPPNKGAPPTPMAQGVERCHAAV